MNEHQLDCLCYNCDENYFSGNKCNKKNIFMAMSDDTSKYDRDVSPLKSLHHANDPIPPYDSP
jgi:hypothetical protein